MSYSAGRDIASESELTTGTKFDIAATDQIRPIVTTTAIIPAIHARTCIPSTSCLPPIRGSQLFRRPDVS